MIGALKKLQKDIFTFRFFSMLGVILLTVILATKVLMACLT